MIGSFIFGFVCFALGWLLRSLWLRGLGHAILDAHRRAFRLWWRWKCRRKGGRPPLDPEMIALIRRMSLENSLWGAPRIHGELLKLGFQLAQSTVSKYMVPRRGRPGQSWETFLRNHAHAIAAVDMLTARTALFDCLYAFIVLAHGRRRILHIEVTNHPTALWLAGEIGRALASDVATAFIVRDNDGAYGAAFRDELRMLGLDDRPTMPASPWQNGHVERLIGSVRRECLDWVLILDANHLRAVLETYADYYNNDRTHLALEKDSTIPRPIERRGRIVSRRAVGGLHRRYSRIPPK